MTPCLPLMSPMFGRVISFPRISRGPSHHKSGSLNNKYEYIPLSIPKQNAKITCPCTNPFRHLARATPKPTRKPFRGHGRFYRPRPPWPPQRSAARPRRHGRSEPPHAAPRSLGRRGSHVFSIFKLRIHACNKNKITTFYRWQ